MNNNRRVTLTLVVGVLLQSQMSFAMKNSNSLRADRVLALTNEAISSLIIAMKLWLSGRYLAQDDDVHRSNEVIAYTLVSSSGEHFDVAEQYVNRLSLLAPTIGDFIADLAGTDTSIIPLNLVSSEAIYFLLQMASGNVDLSNYLSHLTHAQVEKLKQDAQFLDSTALSDLIASSCNQFEMHRNEDMLREILARVGPISRTRLRQVNRGFKQFIDRARMPTDLEGLGWTDTLPVVATILVGKKPKTPQVIGSAVWVPNDYDGTISVIEPSLQHQVIHTIPVGDEPESPVFAGSLIFVANPLVGTLSVIDPAQHYQVVDTIKVGQRPQMPVVVGSYLYVSNYCDGTVLVIDLTQKYRIIHTIKVGMGPLTPVAQGSILYVTNCIDGTISVVDMALDHQVIHVVEVGKMPEIPVALGSLVYVCSFSASSVFVIDPAQNYEVIYTVPVGERPKPPTVAGSLLYVANDHLDSLSVIDPLQNHEVIQTIQVGRWPDKPVALGMFLYVANHFNNTVSVIDLAQKGKVIYTIKVGRGPRTPVIAGSFLYVANHDDGTVSVVDLGGYLPEQSLASLFNEKK